MTILTCQVEIGHPRGISYELGNINGFPLKLGENGLGKGGHLENIEHTP